MKIRLRERNDIKANKEKICIKGKTSKCGMQGEHPIINPILHFEDLEDKEVIVYGRQENGKLGAKAFDKKTMTLKKQIYNFEYSDLVAFDRGVLGSKAKITQVGKARIVKQMLDD